MNTFVESLKEASVEVHDELGPGHSEATYHNALVRELSERGIAISSEGTIPIIYKGSPVGRLRPDLFVECDEGTIIVELKAGSSKGSAQILGYINVLEGDENFDIAGGVLIQFNKTVEVETSEELNA